MNMLLIKSSCVKKKLTFFVLAGIGVPNFLIGALLSGDVSASVAFLMNAENGKILFAKNAEETIYPASTTKIATALYGLSRKERSLDQRVTISSDAVSLVPQALRRSGKYPSYRLEPGGTHMGLKVGEELDLKTLFYGLMLSSANDASNVIAEIVSGTVPKFIEELNVFLQKIGCLNTCFKNPHGMPDLEHTTTAKDLARMAQVAMRNPVFREIVSSVRYVRPETNKQPETVMSQGNALVKPGNKHYYPYATGIKTGYTIQAGHTLVASAQKEGRSLIGVVAHKEGSDKRYRSMVQLFEMAFEEVKQMRTLFSAKHDLFQRKIEGGKDVLKASLFEDVRVSFYPSEEQKYHSQVYWKEPLSLPILEGAVVGEIKIFDEGNRLQEVSLLYAQKTVEPTFSFKIEKLKIETLKQVRKQRREIGCLLAGLLLTGALCKVIKRKKKESHKA